MLVETLYEVHQASVQSLLLVVIATNPLLPFFHRKGENGILREEHRRGGHLPHFLELVGGLTSEVCDAWPVQYQTRLYLPSCRASLLIGPIPWRHSGPLCHALSSSSWTSHAACAIAIAGVRQ